MANPQRFREFIEEIARDNVEWQYDDGIEMNTDAKSFLQYLKALENTRGNIEKAILDQVDCTQMINNTYSEAMQEQKELKYEIIKILYHS